MRCPEYDGTPGREGQSSADPLLTEDVVATQQTPWPSSRPLFMPRPPMSLRAVTFNVVTATDDRIPPRCALTYTDAFGLMGILKPTGFPVQTPDIDAILGERLSCLPRIPAT